MPADTFGGEFWSDPTAEAVESVTPVTSIAVDQVAAAR
jgi:hypothetical protein